MGGVLYTETVGARTLQYVFALHWRQVLVTRPCRSVESWVLNPSTHAQSDAREAPAGVVLWRGQVLTTPVQHQEPGAHRVHGVFWVPAYPGAQ
jgi:hypothetical protein